MKFEKKVSWKFAIALVLVASLISTTFVYVLAVSPSSTFTITSGIYPGAPTYTIWKEGSNYFAKDANGFIGYSGIDAPTVIQSVFNLNPASVFFKAGTYDISGSTVIAYAPIIIEGEGMSSTISGGTLKVNGTEIEYNNAVRNLHFESSGGVIQLWFNGVVHGIIEANHFTKTSYSVGIPNLCLTDCLTIRVRDNWFDGFNMQIIKINGTLATPPLHIISDNDFGSTGVAFPAYTNPWDVAAIYIKGGTNWGINILDNLAYLNPKNIFVYSEAKNIIISHNQIACGYDNYVIDLLSTHNEIVGNYIWMIDDAKGAIAIRDPGNLEGYEFYNVIEGNDIQGANSEAAIYGVFHRSIISNNILSVYRGIELVNSGWNLIQNNYIISLYVAPPAFYGIKETGASDYNVLVGNYVNGTYIFLALVGGHTKITACWNNTVWIEHG